LVGRTLIFSLPLLSPPPPFGRGRIWRGVPPYPPSPSGREGYRWGGKFSSVSPPLYVADKSFLKPSKTFIL